MPEVGGSIQVSVKWHIASSLENVTTVFFMVLMPACFNVLAKRWEDKILTRCTKMTFYSR